MSRATRFFTTSEDLHSIFSLVEQEMRLMYIESGLFEVSEIPKPYLSYKDIPNFGISLKEDTLYNGDYLIFRAEDNFTFRPVVQRRDGRIVYAMDPRENPHIVVLRTGGEYKDLAILAGEVGTAMTTNEVSMLLFKKISKLIKKHCTHIASYWVSAQAKECLIKGYRLTSAIKNPILYDLKL